MYGGLTVYLSEQVRKMTSEVYSQEKCHPMKTFLLPWCQIPLWIVLSFAIRNLAGAFPGATSSGTVPYRGYVSSSQSFVLE